MQKIKFGFVVIGGLLSIKGFTQTKITVQKGQKYQVESSVKMNSVAEAMGQSIESSADSKITTNYEVKDMESSEIKLEATVVKLKVESSAMGQNSSFDSDKTDNSGPGSEELSGLLNKPKTIKLDNTGAITKADAPDDAAAAAIAMMGQDANSSKTDLFIPVLIGKDLKPGDNYPEVSTKTTEKNSTTDSGYYKINSIDNGIASISYTGTQKMTGEMEQMGTPMNLSSTGNVNLEIKMDTRTGLVISKTGGSDATLSIDVMGMTIPSTVKITTTIKVSALQ